ncbi:MAG: hypothetical protein IT183_09300 [Acidobacteria bacterium]|nr:hypothetical protein [Acidobacteriota bacterium]
MLPGKKYSVEDAIAILHRRVWFVLLPAAIAAAGVSLWARSLPDMYASSTTILVMPQRISETIVRPTITSSIAERLPSIRQAILSRTRLEAVIEEFDLYPAERQTMVMEQVVEMMRNNHISTSIVRDDAFEVGFVGSDPAKVMQVTERLGRLFIDQSLSYRHNLMEDTDTFLDSQLAETRRQLEQQEQRLAAYKRAYAGELPSQVTSNLQQVTNAQNQIQNSVNTINRAMERRLVLEKILADLEAPAPAPTPAAPVTTDAGRVPAVPSGPTLQQLTVAQDEVAALQARGLKPGHPDLEAAQRRVRDLGQRLQAESQASGTAAGVAAPRPMSAAEASRLARIAETRAELEELNRQITRAREEEREAREIAQTSQARLDALPTRETEMIALMRDYGIIESSYKGLLAKREEARISASLERRQVGEQFSILDPARLPERPFSPDRQRYNLMGVVGGLVFGLALVALIEYRDRSFKTDEEIAAVLGLPVLAVVPLMKSADDRRRELWKRFGLGTVFSVIVVGCVAVFVYAVAG